MVSNILYHVCIVYVLCMYVCSIEKRWGGQRGIVSCIAMLPTHEDIYAIGSYSNQG